MNKDAQIVAAYSNHALECIICDLSRNGQWPQRLKAAINEQARRK